MKRLILSFLVLLVCSMFSLGCKNICQKGAQNYMDCWQQHCEANADDTRCESRLNNSMAEAMLEASSCPNEERATTLAEATCDELTAEDGPGI